MIMLFVVSVTFRNHTGDLLLVRKHGTDTFMLPGGKLEPGESHEDAAVREVREEVGLVVTPDQLSLLGCWSADAANEPGLRITSDVFTADLVGEPTASSEIEELRWLPLGSNAADAPRLAPLLTEHVIPALQASPSW